MNELTDNKWMKWKSVKDAWDEQTVQYMDFDEKLKTIGRPVYAFYQHGYPVEYVAHYYFECATIYPRSVIERSMKYCERKFYPSLSAKYADVISEYRQICDEMNIPFKRTMK